MALKIHLFYVVLWFTFVQLSLFAVSYEYTKPQILSEYETIVEVGDNFTVLCQGNTPLTWSWPEVKDANYSTWTTIELSNVIPKDHIYKYASRLFLHNATYQYTGFFNCFGKNVDPSNEDQVAKIYLYVRDQEHLSVKDMEVDTLLVTQYSDVVIPCRPTSPDVKVELSLITGEPTDNATYDPKTGFKFYVDALSDEGLYFCNFVKDDAEFDLSFFVKVSPMTDSLAKPLLEEVSGGHTVFGEKLVLECRVRAVTFVTFSWITPSGPPDLTRMDISTSRRNHLDQHLVFQQIAINRTTTKDKGTYYCNVSDNQNHHSSNNLNVTIFNLNEHFINVSEENGVYELSPKAGEPFVQWRIDVRGHPEPTLIWLNNKNESIQEGFTDKYFAKMSSTEALLKIKNIAITDFGNYTLVAENKFETKTLVLFLNVTDKPSVQIETKDFYLVDKPAQIKCIAAAYPKPTIQWSFKPCQDNSCTFTKMEEVSSREEGLKLISYVSIKSKHSGYVKCNAKNSVGADEIIQGFYVTDVQDGFDIFGFDSTVDVNEATNEAKIAVGEAIRMTCAVSVYNYTKEIAWFRNGKKLKADNKYTMESSQTEYTNRLSLSFADISFVDGGIYSCRVSSNSGYEYKNVSFLILEPSAPVINATNMNKDVEMNLPKRHEFYCKVSGVPKPKIEWFKNGATLPSSKRIRFLDKNQKLSFEFTESLDEGTYKCEATNKAGVAFKQSSLKFKNNPALFNQWLIYTICFLVSVVIITVIFIIIKIRKEKRLQKELRIAGLANFEKGALENLNPDLGIDDQAELLPYDKKWEFPIEKLKLGKQLGSGAFGVVMKGEAKNIVDDEETTIVAVKMVKKNAGHTYIKALASELKIMVHLGKHLNVVNLLGACTKNVAKRELLVIVEYCRFGNVQNYLLRHRDNYIDQVDPKSGHLDYMIGQDILERTYSVSSNRSNSHSPLMKYAVVSFSNSNSGGPQVPHDMVDYRGNDYNGTTAKTDITTVSMCPNTDDEEIVLSNNSSVQPEWRSNYKGDYKGNVRPICTKDLLAWAFQVSRGMEYLASRRVLHGDLAARNILLTDNNVVKICDFGLAKSMYKNDNYKKKGDGPLPVKWMAIESIRDKVFSTQSDVWSFGIVLWEFFSLARTPYPGMEADERLYNKLVDGYRMESPEYAPKEIYKMMLDCWQTKPLTRPSFTKIAERIGSMLEDTVRKHYIDLNDPYLVMNTQRLEEGHSDYLAMMSPPNFENLSSPHQYANDLPPSEDTPGYLCMKPASIFSPRADDERIFDFDDVGTNKKDKNSTEGTRNELLPMLSGNSESDCESSTCNSPIVPNSFSNPSYHLPPIVERDQTKPERDLVKFSDNYVNIAQSKNALKENNPFVKIGKDKTNVNYVNSTSRDWESVKL